MAAERRRRLACAGLEAKGARAFVGLSWASHFFLDSDPVVALTGFRSMDACAVILESNGACTLIVSPSWDAARAVRQCPDIRVIGSDATLREVSGVLAGCLAKAGRVLLARDAAMDRACAASLDEALAAASLEVEDAGRWLAPLLARKSDDEMADVLRATEIGEQCLARLRRILRPGMRECDLAAELLHDMQGLGAGDNFFLISAARHNVAVRSPTRRVLEAGDILLAEITPMVNNQYSQLCRTIVLGEYEPLLQERFDLLDRAFEAARRAAVPGRPLGEAARAANAVIAEAGFGDYCRPPYMRVRGHGLGNVSSYPGDVGTDSDVSLREGMVFVLHPNQYFPDVGYLMCGEPVRIGDESGARILTRERGQLEVIAA